MHGHLQLALCGVARLQRERVRKFSAVFLCGDVGTFTEEEQLDSATRQHARDNPCELEFLTQWSFVPQPPWIDAIFWPQPDGLGLDCPLVMVHGNHEGFTHLETLYSQRRRRGEAVPIADLPAVDTGGHILFLPPGWRGMTADGYMFGGIGGMEAGQRRAKYHPMAYIQDDWVQDLLGSKLDILLTHQGPARVQGDHGSLSLDPLLDAEISRFWFHGHSTPIKTRTTVGGTTVVPLGDLAFSKGVPGSEGWAILDWSDEQTALHTDPPDFLREVHLRKWRQTPGGRLVHPDLLRFLEQ